MGFSHRLGVQYKGFWKPPPVVSGGAAWSPTDIAGLQLWLDFSDITTLYTDSGKTTPVTADDDVIGCAADKSGNGNDATQGTTGNKPTYKTAIQNGLSIARFITDDQLVFSGVSYTNMHWFCIAKNRVQDTNGMIWGEGGAHSGQFSAFGTGAASMEWNNINHVSELFTQTNFNLIEFIYDGTKEYIAINTSKDAGTEAANETEVPAYIGSRGGAIYLDGDIAEVFCYNAEITGTDLTALQSYIDTKWSLPY